MTSKNAAASPMARPTSIPECLALASADLDHGHPTTQQLPTIHGRVFTGLSLLLPKVQKHVESCRNKTLTEGVVMTKGDATRPGGNKSFKAQGKRRADHVDEPLSEEDMNALVSIASDE